MRRWRSGGANMTPDFRIYLLQLLFSILYKGIKARKSQKLEWKFSKKLFFNGDISSITFRFLSAFFVSLSGFQNLSRPLSMFAKANETFCLLAKNKFSGTLIIGRREISPPYPWLLPLAHRPPACFCHLCLSRILPSIGLYVGRKID